MFKTLRGFSDFQRSKTDNPKTLKDEIAKMNMKSENSHVIHEEDEIDQSIKKSIDSILGSSFVDEPEPKIENDKNLKLKQETDIRSSILWFSYRYNL